MEEKGFFKCLKVKHSRELISAIEIEGQKFKEPAEVHEAFVNFYAGLFHNKEEPSRKKEEFWTRYAKELPIVVSPYARGLLDKPISREELRGALKEMEEDKSPGPDGLSAKWFKWTWDMRTRCKAAYKYVSCQKD